MALADGCRFLTAEDPRYKELLRMRSGKGKGKVHPRTGHEGQKE